MTCDGAARKGICQRREGGCWKELVGRGKLDESSHALRKKISMDEVHLATYS